MTLPSRREKVLVEAVAKAIYEAAYAHRMGYVEQHPWSWTPLQDRYREKARAAIAVVCEALTSNQAVYAAQDELTCDHGPVDFAHVHDALAAAVAAITTTEETTDA